MCVLISEPSLLGVKGFIGAVLVLLGAQAGGPGLLQGCSLCGSVKPVTPSLPSPQSVRLWTGHCCQDTRGILAGKYLAPKHLSSCLLSPRQFPSVRAPHKELRVLLVRELSEARDSESAADIYNLRPVWPRNIKTIKWGEFMQLDILQEDF